MNLRNGLQVVHTLVLLSAAAFAPAPARAAEAAFDPFLVPLADAPTADELRLLRRNRMLKWHQSLGYVTLGLMTAQVALGWVQFAEWKANGLSRDFFRRNDWHLGLGVSAWTMYTTQASLSIFAPKIERDGRRDSVWWHRALAWVHGTGMMVMPILGYAISENRNDLLRRGANGKPGYDAAIKSHAAIGTVTYAALVGAYLTITLP